MVVPMMRRWAPTVRVLEVTIACRAINAPDASVGIRNDTHLCVAMGDVERGCFQADMFLVHDGQGARNLKTDMRGRGGR